MAFLATEPQDTTKIRNLGTVIRPNWSAIQTGDSTFKPYALNLIERTSVPVAGDPTAIADTFIIYCKDDPDGNPEFFGIDAGSQVIQLTQDGAIGSSTTKLSGSSITFDKGVTTMSKDQQVSGWLRVSGAGAVVASSQNLTPANDLTVTRVSAGLYTIGFTVAPVTTDFVGMATCANTSSRRSISCENYTATTFQVRIYSNSTGSNEDEPFQVIVFGGR